MALNVHIVDGTGGSNKAKINGEGQLSAVIHPHPPKDEVETAAPYRSYFHLNGDGTTTDMRVNGSANEQRFYIEASPDTDIYIKSISVVIADASATLNRFGNIAALSNGVKFEWATTDLGTTEIHEGLVSNFDFVRLAGGQPAFGDSASAFRGGNVQGTSEGYIPFLDMSSIFGLPWGLRLRKGTTDKLIWTIRDDVSALDAFNIIAYGIKF